MKLSIDGSTLKLSNLILSKGGKRTYLSADVSAAAVAFYVVNFSGFADDDYLLIGEWGEPTAEIIQLSATPTTTTMANVGSAFAYDHYADTPITVIPCNKVQFARAATLVDPNDAGAVTQLGSDIAIMAYRKETIYEDATNTTGFGYARFMKSQATAAYSEYTVGVAYEGSAYNSIDEIAKAGVSLVNLKVGDKHAEEDKLMRDSNEAQNIIVKKQDWIFELVKNDTSIASTENEYKYALSGLTYAMKYPNSKQGILNVKFASKTIKYLDIHEFDELFKNVSITTLSADAAAAATSVTLTDSYEFAESGTIYIGSNTITYTANAQSTGILTGVPASGTGSIVTGVSSGDAVWQGLQPGIPTEYSIFNGNIYLNKPVETDEAGKKLKFKYLKALARFDTFDDVVEIPFYEAIEKYIAYKVESRRGNKENALLFKSEFDEIVSINMKAYKLPTLEELEYYNLGF